MGKHVIETLMGAIVLIVATSFLIFAYRSSGVATTTGYKLYANFDRIDGLNLGTDVRISGIKVGTVSNQYLDTKTYLATVVMTIDNTVKIPVDSSAEIASDGLLGSKYLALVPGGEDDVLKNGGRIKHTQSSVNIESLIGKFMYGGAGDNAEAKPKANENGGVPSLEETKPVDNEENTSPEPENAKPADNEKSSSPSGL